MLTAVFFFVGVVSAFPQLNPPAGAERIDLFSAPGFLGGYPSVASGAGASGNLINPAIGADLRLPALEAGYSGLIGSGSTGASSGYRGHFLSIDSVLPISVGTVGLHLRGFRSTLSTASFGTGFSIDAGMAKQVMPDLALGASLGFSLVGQPSSSVYATEPTDWGLAGTIGFVHRISSVAIPDLRWGMVLARMGKGAGSGSAFDYIDESGEPVVVTSLPPVFTLQGGISARFIETRNFALDVAADLTAPSFQNLELGLSTGIEIARLVGLRIGTSYNLRGLLPHVAPEPRSFVPGITLSLDLDAALGGERTDDGFSGALARGGFGESVVSPAVAFAPLGSGLYGFSVGTGVVAADIDREGPSIVVDYPGHQVLSPSGSVYGIEYPIEITDRRYVTGFELSIEDERGSTIWQRTAEANRFASSESAFFGQVVDGLGHRYRSVEIPEFIRWDGTLEDGSLPDDGEYRVFVSAVDDSGNESVAGPYSFSIDATPPQATVTIESVGPAIFSPNNDGNKDTLAIAQRGSVETLWTGEIRRDRFVVREFSWRDSAPEDVIWDGRGETGDVLSDGTYFYVLSSTDSAGNSTEVVSDPFVLNTQSTPIQIGIDRGVFSPNGDGILDTITFDLDVPVQDGVVAWVAEILDAGGNVRRSIRGTGVIPDSIAYDGAGDDGERLPEGVYVGKLSVRYASGNTPSERSPQFEIDVTAPEAAVSADLALFSPNGDGNKDEITFFQDAGVEDTWTGTIVTDEGALIFETSWRGTPERKFVWDGHAQNGLLARNGRHFYQLSAVDRAGNSGGSNPVEFEVNYEETALVFTRAYEAISPNGDGTLDVQRFSVLLDVTEGVESYTLTILDSGDRVVRRITERAVPGEEITWQGVSDSGSLVPDGIYRAQMSVLYENGNRPAARTRQFVVDTVVPTVAVSTDVVLFSPNRDGNRDTVTFTSSSSNETLWEGTIKSVDGRVVRRVFWPGETSSYVWDGTDEAGNLVADGLYTLEIATTDAAGNRAWARTAEVKLDTRLTSIFIGADRARFSPNGDGVDDTITLTLSTSVRDGVTSWDVRIRRNDGTVIRSFSGSSRIPERIIWDGRDAQNRVREGEFYAEYAVRYAKGDAPSINSSPFTVDVSPPELTILTAPTPFSPDGDGVDDTLTFTIGVSDAGSISVWELTIDDSRGNEFMAFYGEGRPPRTIEWDGVSESGELVQSAEDYTFNFVVSDSLGNRSRARGTIPVDILVLRDGDELKIMITNITFEADSPTLESADDDKAEKNAWVLTRLADILKKYSTYFIRIEGHAVSVYWDDPEQAAVEQEEELVPLSEARAETVKRALVARGIDEERITTVGVGGSRPVVPHGDEDQRWKNRRVEFILLK